MQFELREAPAQIRHRAIRCFGNRLVPETHVTGNRVQTVAFTCLARLCRVRIDVAPRALFAALFCIEAVNGETRAEAPLAPAELRVEGKQSRIQLGKAGTAGWTSTPRREHGRRGVSAFIAQHAHDALAMFERGGEQLAQLRFVSGAHGERAHGQFDRVFLEAIEPRPFLRREHLAIDSQLGEALLVGPRREILVDTFTRRHERREQRHVAAFEILEHPRGDGIEALRLDRDITGRTELSAELHVQQTHEVIDLGQRCDRALATATAGALLDRNGWRNAEDGIDIRSRGGLHELSRIGIKGFEITTLAFAEDDVERERRLARTRDARDDREPIAWQLDVDVLQVVLASTVNADRVRTRRPHGQLRDLRLGNRRLPSTRLLDVLAHRLACV